MIETLRTLLGEIPRIADRLRISIGTDAECDRLVVVLKEILRWNGD